VRTGAAVRRRVLLFECQPAPEEFRLDNLATYYLDARSPLAAAYYNLLAFLLQSGGTYWFPVADPAVFTFYTPTGESGAGRSGPK